MAFPQVITRVIDNSQVPQNYSRFRAGLVGVAERGPFNSIVDVPSIYEFVRQFGKPISGTYLGDAVALIQQTSDGCKVVRVGAQYQTLASATGSGNSGSFSITTADATKFSPGQYVRVSQVGKKATLNAVVSTAVGSTITFVAAGSNAKSLLDNYTTADIGASAVSNAANPAEAFLTAPTYSAAVTGLGTVSGNKTDFQFVCTGSTAGLAVGNVIKLEQTGKASTREVKISQIRGDGTVFLQTINDTQVGYRALSLQDQYTAATVSVVASQTGQVALQLAANTAGTWANTTGTTGLYVHVGPGSAPDTKQLYVYKDGILVENIDNLSATVGDANYYTTRINGLSQYIAIGTIGVLSTEPPGNTYNPWNTATYPISNVATFSKGYNGENVVDIDYIGTIDPNTEVPSGLKLFESSLDASEDVDFICCPDTTSIAVYQEIARIAGLVNSVGIGSIPDNLNIRDAIDWHNGVGLYSANGKIDNYRMALFWNWFQYAETFTGNLVYVPPALGYLRAAARTFDQAKPWYAAAGDIRGVLPEALQVRYKYVSKDSRNAMYGNGNSVNPIMLIGNSIEVYGDRTLQRSETKLTALHNVVLVNTILKGFSNIARRYTFDPIDNTLFQQLTLDYTNYMEAVRSERGVEGYSITLNSSNNTPTTRNQRQVIVDLAIIPVDVAEVFIITATVNSSGAQLLSVTPGTSA